MKDTLFLKEDFKMARIVRQLAKSNTYCVGAVLKCKNGNKYAGCNIENASHTSIPAEIVVFTKALSEGEQYFERLVVIGGPKDTDNFSKYLPCKEAIEFIQTYAENDFPIYNIYESVINEPKTETYTIEQLVFINSYYLQMTEQYSKTYYSATPKIIKTETTSYSIRKDLELPTSVSPIKIKDFSCTENGVWRVFAEFLNENPEYEIVEISLENPQTIILTIGNPDISRTSACKLEIIRNI